MSFDSSNARDRSQTQPTTTAVPSPPGKRGGTDRLSAPTQTAPVARDHDGTTSTLAGTSWLSGVLGFGDELHGEATMTTTGTAEDMTSAGGESESDEGASGEVDDEASGDVAEVLEGKADGPTTGGKAKKPPVRVKHNTIFQAPNGASDARTTIGVGELVHFAATELGSWSADRGTKHGAAARDFFWASPDTAGTATITFHHGKQAIHNKLRVVAPNTLAMKVASFDSIPKGTMGAGMITNVTIGPASVSFGNVEWLEVPGGPTSISGYFKDHGAPNHHPNPNWLPWNVQNTGLQDHASISGYPKPWYPGGFTWYIPNRYRVTTVGGSGHVFIHTHQVFRITDKKGTTTVTKGGAGVTRSP